MSDLVLILILILNVQCRRWRRDMREGEKNNLAGGQDDNSGIAGGTYFDVFLLGRLDNTESTC